MTKRGSRSITGSHSGVTIASDLIDHHGLLVVSHRCSSCATPPSYQYTAFQYLVAAIWILAYIFKLLSTFIPNNLLLLPVPHGPFKAQLHG